MKTNKNSKIIRKLSSTKFLIICMTSKELLFSHISTDYSIDRAFTVQ